MKVSRIVKLCLAAVCFLLVSNTVVAAEEASWSLDDKNYSLVRQYQPGEFYNRTSVDVVHDTQNSMGYLHIDGGHIKDELFDFSISLYEADKWGSGESIWHENYDTIQVNISFSQIREWDLEPGDYLISVAAKSWGEDASLDMYDLTVSEKPVEKPVKVTKPGKVTIQTVKRSAAKKAKITWKKVKGDGIRYEIQYSTTKKFNKKNTVTQTLKKTTINISKLNKNKKYYVRVRAYKVVNGEKVYGAYSKAKTVNKWKK